MIIIHQSLVISFTQYPGALFVVVLSMYEWKNKLCPSYNFFYGLFYCCCGGNIYSASLDGRQSLFTGLIGWAVSVKVEFELLNTMRMSCSVQWRQLEYFGNVTFGWVGCSLVHWSFWVYAKLVVAVSPPSLFVCKGVWWGAAIRALLQTLLRYCALPLPLVPFGMWLKSNCSDWWTWFVANLWSRDLWLS